MHRPPPLRNLNRFTWREATACVLGCIMLGALGWAMDVLVVPKERVVYSVACSDGSWVGLRCTGRMLPGERFAFLPSIDRQEVIYWTVESQVPSEKFIDCQVRDQRNWVCKDRFRQSPMIPCAMVQGRPVDPDRMAAPTIHGVSKWKWWALDLGIRALNRADF